MASESSSNRTWLLSCLLAYLALGVLLALALYHRAHRPVFVNEPPRIAQQSDQAPLAIDIDNQLDPNTAEWYDLARLPRLGEGLARRIVAYRQARLLEWRSAHPDQTPAQAPPVFARPEDLLPVKGIGPKILDQIRPFLRFDATRQTEATQR